jgi:hypothetical protein
MESESGSAVTLLFKAGGILVEDYLRADLLLGGCSGLRVVFSAPGATEKKKRNYGGDVSQGRLIDCLYSDLELEGSGKWMPVVQIGSVA